MSTQPTTADLASFLLAGGADRALLLVANDGRILEAHGAAAEIFGGANELRGMNLGALVPAGATAPAAKPRRLLEQILGGRHVRRRCWCLRPDRSRFWAEIIAAPIETAAGAVVGATVAVRDLSELRAAESAVKSRRPPATRKDRPEAEPPHSAGAMLEGISNALFAIDADMRFVYVNARCAQMLRKPREQLLGVPIWDELPAGEGSSFHRQLQKAATERLAVEFEEYYPLLNAWFEVHAYPFSGGVVVHFWDISDRKLEETRSRQQSLRDPLTGVANALLFQDRAANAVARAQRTGATLAVLLIDIDGLGEVNSRHGHAVGDLLLQAVARRLAGVVRESDTLARLGGDEFAILTSDHREADGPAVLAEKLLAAAAQDFNLPDPALDITASIGIALFPSDGQDAESLTQAADAALARAKAQGGSTYRFFSPDQTEEVQRRRAIETGLRLAIAASEFDVVYQPERSLATGDISAMEALPRWNKTDGTLVRPRDFMPAVYAADVVVKMDAWVLRQVCTDRRSWLDAGISAVPVTVNVSATTIMHGDLVAMVRAALSESGLDASLLEIEFSQPALAERREAQVSAALHRLHDLGVRLSLDDVGKNGWASLTALERFPFEKIKIDPRALVANGVVADEGAAIRAASSFAHAMNRTVVAEGVETASQLEFMRSCGCDAVQGDYVGAAVRAEGSAAILEIQAPGA